MEIIYPNNELGIGFSIGIFLQSWLTTMIVAKVSKYVALVNILLSKPIRLSEKQAITLLRMTGCRLGGPVACAVQRLHRTGAEFAIA
jgi:hypothetical protein